MRPHDLLRHTVPVRETGGTPVKRLQVWLVVDVQPPAPRRPSLIHRGSDYRLAQALPLVGWVNNSVEKKPVRASIPHDVDERQQVIPKEGASPGEAVSA